MRIQNLDLGPTCNIYVSADDTRYDITGAIEAIKSYTRNITATCKPIDSGLKLTFGNTTYKTKFIPPLTDILEYCGMKADNYLLPTPSPLLRFIPQ